VLSHISSSPQSEYAADYNRMILDLVLMQILVVLTNAHDEAIREVTLDPVPFFFRNNTDLLVFQPYGDHSIRDFDICYIALNKDHFLYFDLYVHSVPPSLLSENSVDS